MPDDSSPHPDPQLSPRERLELKKIEAEIAQLQRPVWKQGGFWASMAAISVPLLTVIVAYGSGWFDLKQLELKNEKKLLEAETVKLEASKVSLTDQTANLVKEKASLETDKAALMSQLSELMGSRAEQQARVIVATNELRILTSQIMEKESLVGTLNTQIAELTSQNAALQKLAHENAALQNTNKAMQAELLEAQLAIAVAHEHARGLIGRSAASMLKIFDTKEFIGKSMDYNVAIGRWRAVYESDIRRFRLGRFTNEITGIVDTNLLAELETRK